MVVDEKVLDCWMQEDYGNFVIVIQMCVCNCNRLVQFVVGMFYSWFVVCFWFGYFVKVFVGDLDVEQIGFLILFFGYSVFYVMNFFQQ